MLLTPFSTYFYVVSTVNGGPYKLIPSIPTATAYLNNGLHSGTTYYYRITVMNSSGLECPKSSQVSAKAL